ncbi:hypothetical protein XENOCAPTIV_028855, partial [Xenoophorus captivus]
LTSRPALVQDVAPSSFQFCWGGEDGSDGPSLQHMKLGKVVSLNHGVSTPSNFKYWHPPLRTCKPRSCTSHYSNMEPTLPRSFVWMLQLFSFMLDVEPWYLFEEVLEVERRVFGIKTPQSGQQIPIGGQNETGSNTKKWNRNCETKQDSKWRPSKETQKLNKRRK